LTTEEYNKRGGISRYIAELAEHFANEHEVHVFAAGWKDVSSKDIIFHKVPVIPKISGPRVISSIQFTAQNTLRFRLSGSKYDIIHINGCDSVKQDIITAHSIHRAGMDFKKKYKEVQGLGFLDLFTLKIERINYSHRNYKKIICDSSSSKDELMKYYRVPEGDIEVIPLGVNLNEFKPLSEQDKINLRKKYGFSQDDMILIIVATEFFRKGLKELIQALDILQKKNLKPKLLIVGKGSPEGKLSGSAYYRELADKMGLNKSIVFLGHVQNLNNYYNISDIFVFPTKYEAFGIPMLEAMAAGLPVLNSKIGAGELITYGMNGIHLDDPNNIEEIADKLEMLIKDEKLRKELGKNARSTAMNYSWDETARKTMDVYNIVLKN
jgi:UDP-glucose:(heptosyl)LPS alpha-1,3-glucosyltransferase